MASHALIWEASRLPLHIALSVIPSLPRPLLSRLVERAMERLDEMDGEPDREDDDPTEYTGDEQDQDTPEYWVRFVTVSDL
jgi:hypothetical protein